MPKKEEEKEKVTRYSHVVFVKEFALVAALAESLKPVLADVSNPGRDVFIRAGVAERAVAFLE